MPWGGSVGSAGPPFFVVMETVKAAKSFIEGELEKYGTWEGFLASACGGQVQIVNATSI